MSLDQVREAAIRNGIRQKEYVCRRRPADIRPVIDVWRGEELIATAVPRIHDRDLILRTFQMCAVGFDADALAMTFESYTTGMSLPKDLDNPTPEEVAEAQRRSVNPMTGKEWRQGELSDAAKNHGGIEKGWVWEAVSISCANRAGDVVMTQLPYRYAAGHVVWENPVNAPPGMDVEGPMPEAMIGAMNAPSMAMVLPYRPDEGTRAERDVWAAEKIMAVADCRVALFSLAANKDRVRVLRTAGIPLS